MPADVRLQQPPATYTQTYFSQLVRDIRQLFNTTINPAQSTIGILTLTGSPTLAAGFPPGTVYVDGSSGILKIVLANQAYAPSFAITVALGTVVATGH